MGALSFGQFPPEVTVLLDVLFVAKIASFCAGFLDGENINMFLQRHGSDIIKGRRTTVSNQKM